MFGRKRKKLNDDILVEAIDTLCSICRYLESDSIKTSNPHGVEMKQHFNNLKNLEMELKGMVYFNR